MNAAIELDTPRGIVRSTSDALARAAAELVADLVAAECRATERDLLAAVSLSFADSDPWDATALLEASAA